MCFVPGYKRYLACFQKGLFTTTFLYSYTGTKRVISFLFYDISCKGSSTGPFSMERGHGFLFCSGSGQSLSREIIFYPLLYSFTGMYVCAYCLCALYKENGKVKRYFLFYSCGNVSENFKKGSNRDLYCRCSHYFINNDCFNWYTINCILRAELSTFFISHSYRVLLMLYQVFRFCFAWFSVFLFHHHCIELICGIKIKHTT